jgi:hypothetical protein
VTRYRQVARRRMSCARSRRASASLSRTARGVTPSSRPVAAMFRSRRWTRSNVPSRLQKVRENTGRGSAAGASLATGRRARITGLMSRGASPTPNTVTVVAPASVGERMALADRRVLDLDALRAVALRPARTRRPAGRVSRRRSPLRSRARTRSRSSCCCRGRSRPARAGPAPCSAVASWPGRSCPLFALPGRPG